MDRLSLTSIHRREVLSRRVAADIGRLDPARGEAEDERDDDEDEANGLAVGQSACSNQEAEEGQEADEPPTVLSTSIDKCLGWTFHGLSSHNFRKYGQRWRSRPR